MKKIVLRSTFDKGEVLSRTQLKKVMGGTGSTDNAGNVTCTAVCGPEFTITCNGDKNCSATDYVGCKSDLEEKSCILA
ncbi:hypothetical protein [Pedobacter borealis]|uniref:hypothetical protein n=1 Tax=Pedobacter borealis TaxID=475254 RepID=UPI000493ACDF|nr:hypothetical protein [Pedobacter borealis]